MEIRREQHDTITLLTLIGRLEASTVAMLKEKVKTSVAEKNIHFVIDLDQVNFVDSSGLGGLVASLRTVNKQGGDIKISRLQPDVRSVFELTRLHRLFDIYDNPQAAEQSF